MAQYDKEHCYLCLEEFSDRPTQQALSEDRNNLIRLSEEQEKTNLTVYLKNFKHSDEVLYVHKDCRRKFTDTRHQSTMSVPAKKLRSSMSVAFDWKYFCFFCSSKVDFRNKDRNKPRRVMTINIKNNVLLAAENRKDDWGEEVFGRLAVCNDLVVEEAVYHSAYMAKFSKKTDSGKIGHPISEEKVCYFEMLCEWLEKDGDCELYTLQELFAKMEEVNNGNTSTYSEKSLQSKLKEKYRDHIYFMNLPGRSNIVCFRDMASYILYE